MIRLVHLGRWLEIILHFFRGLAPPNPLPYPLPSVNQKKNTLLSHFDHYIIIANHLSIVNTHRFNTPLALFAAVHCWFSSVCLFLLRRCTPYSSVFMQMRPVEAAPVNGSGTRVRLSAVPGHSARVAILICMLFWDSDLVRRSLFHVSTTCCCSTRSSVKGQRKRKKTNPKPSKTR